MARAKSDLVCRWGFSINSCRGFVHCNFAVVILGISVKNINGSYGNKQSNSYISLGFRMKWSICYHTSMKYTKDRVNSFIVLLTSTITLAGFNNKISGCFKILYFSEHFTIYSKCQFFPSPFFLCTIGLHQHGSFFHLMILHINCFFQSPHVSTFLSFFPETALLEVVHASRDCLVAGDSCSSDETCSPRLRTLRQCVAGNGSMKLGPGARSQCASAVSALLSSPLHGCQCKRGMKKEKNCLSIYWSLHQSIIHGI